MAFNPPQLPLMARLPKITPTAITAMTMQNKKNVIIYRLIFGLMNSGGQTRRQSSTAFLF
jgi:hypothetical protein